MKNQRIIIIGDVHGCLDELKALLAKVSYLPGKDRLIFVGDLINKGPYSLEVLQMVVAWQAEVVMGNHERGFLRYLEDASYASAGFLRLKQQMGSQLAFWQDWLRQLPNYIEEEEFIVVHGGLIPNQHPSQTPLSLLTTIRTWDGQGVNLNNPSDPPWYECYHHPKLAVFGHWAQKELVRRKNALGLDTGCVYGNQLTAAILPGPSIYQVSAKRKYDLGE